MFDTEVLDLPNDVLEVRVPWVAGDRISGGGS